ncbi:MAG: hypothetical protein ACTSRK_14105, partial [Promethearchaeota archaeon]
MNIKKRYGLIVFLLINLCGVSLLSVEIYSFSQFSTENLANNGNYHMYSFNSTHFLLQEKHYENELFHDKLFLLNQDFDQDLVMEIDGEIIDLTISANNLYIVTGQFNFEGMYIDPVLLKFDLNFNEIWNRTIYGNFDRIGSINQD